MVVVVVVVVSSSGGGGNSSSTYPNQVHVASFICLSNTSHTSNSVVMEARQSPHFINDLQD